MPADPLSVSALSVPCGRLALGSVATPALRADNVDAARSMGASRPRMFAEVLLPGAMPAIVTGLRVGLGYGWRGLVAAEIIATSAGLGYSIFLAQKFFRTDIIIVGMITIGLLWLVTDRALLAPLERRTVERWGMKAVIS